MELGRVHFELVGAGGDVETVVVIQRDKLAFVAAGRHPQLEKRFDT